MEKKIFIDEAGNTGYDVMNLQQPFFVFAAIMLDANQETNVLSVLNEEFIKNKEKEENEIKGAKWSKSAHKANALLNIEKCLFEAGAHVAVVVFEKRFMPACLIIDNFFDYVYNPKCSINWVNCKDLKLYGANYFYECLVFLT